MTGRARLDQELVRRGRFPSRSAARNAIRSGFVLVGGVPSHKPAQQVSAETQIDVAEEAGDYVGRGAYKLLAALDGFGIDVAGRDAVDVGASTGGFTQVLLEAGAARVVALDVGRDQIHPRLRKHPRVVVCEGTNVRDADVAAIGGPFAVVTVDVSFISLRALVSDIEALGSADADWIVLVKPQFEVGRDGLSKDGVVRSVELRRRVVADVARSFATVGLVPRGVLKSPITGGDGNEEALLWMRRDGVPIVSLDPFKVRSDE
ncbi:MAG: TlyA family RNA methyltransferase [Acidimicrobiia bacterium]|nr:TlyA family RNA methyltransferase [Acidimicrobiia bacterium]